MTKFEYSAGAFIYRMVNGKVFLLLLQKPNNEYDIPKGHIEKGETSEQAAKREIREETGIDAEFLPSFNVTTNYFFKQGGETIAKKVKYFISMVSKPDVKISYEHKGYEWVTQEEALKKLRFKDLIKITSEAFEYIKRYNRISEINERYARLPSRGTWRLSRNLVPGEGRLDTGLMIIGQAPGAEEDAMRRPFIGRSGKLLDEVLEKAGISRKDAYITSVVQFFPPKNRIPDKDEVRICMPFLKEQIDVVKPRYVVLLGNVSAHAVLEITGAETNHGTIVKRDGITYVVTLHPAAVLRFKSKYGLMLGDLKKFAQIIDRNKG